MRTPDPNLKAAISHPIPAMSPSMPCPVHCHARCPGAPRRAAKRQLRDSELGAGGEDEAEGGALGALAEALQLAEEIQDLKAQRALVRLRARALRQSGERAWGGVPMGGWVVGWWLGGVAGGWWVAACG